MVRKLECATDREIISEEKGKQKCKQKDSTTSDRLLFGTLRSSEKGDRAKKRTQ